MIESFGTLINLSHYNYIDPLLSETLYEGQPLGEFACYIIEETLLLL